MTVEAKLRITAQLDGAVAALNNLRDKLLGTGKAARDADAAAATPKAPAALERTAAAARKAGEDLGRIGREVKLSAAQAQPALQAVATRVQAIGATAQQAVGTAVAALGRLASGAQSTGQSLQQADRASTFSQTRRGLDSISTQLQAVRNQVLGFLGIQQGAQGVAAIVRMSDEYQALQARLKLATRSQEEYAQALATTRALATRYQQPLAETASLYTRVLRALTPLGGGTRDAAVATEALLAALKINGTAASESAAAILQYSQALASGRVQGDEFRTVTETAPTLVAALAGALSKTTSEFRAMSEAGEITTAMIVRASRIALPQLQEQAAKIPPTVTGAFLQLRDAVQQYLATTFQASGTGRLMIEVLQGLAVNIGVLAEAIKLLGGLAIVTFLGRWVGGLQQAAAAAQAARVAAQGLGPEFLAMRAALNGGATAATTAATSTGALATAGRGLLALFGGPVGLIAALAALTAGWLGLRIAQKRAEEQQPDTAADEARRVREEIEQLEAARAAGRLRPGDEAYLRQLRAELPGREEAAMAAARERFRVQERQQDAEAKLRNFKAAEDFRKQYQTKEEIVEDFERKRAEAAEESQAKVAELLAKGDTRGAERERRTQAERERLSRLAQAQAVRNYDQAGQVTRLAQFKESLDSQGALLADELERERRLNQEFLDRGLQDYQSYAERRARIEAQAADVEIARLRAELDQRRQVLASNEAIQRRTPRGTNEFGQASETVAGNRTDVLRLEVELEKALRGQAEAQRQVRVEGQLAREELERTLAEIDGQRRQARGEETPADIAERVRRSFLPQFRQAVQRGATEDELGVLGLAQQDATRRELLADQAARLQQLRTDLAQREEAVRNQEAVRAISEEEAERRILELRREQLPLLQEIEQQLARLAVSPAERAQARAAALENERLADTRTAVQKTLDENARGGLSQLFTDIVSGAKTAGEALRSMLANFANQMLELISRRLGNRLFESFGIGKVVDNAAAFVTTALGFHQGGVVSASGASFRRSIDLSPLAAALAPRYHTGGIVGMRPNERLAVLEEGEEVLTADDPRHARNLRGGMLVQANVTINGASGDRPRQERAADDLQRVMRTAIDTWAVEQSRPGGILYGN